MANNQTIEGGFKTTAASLLDKYAARKENTVVTLPDGETLQFRAITRLNELDELFNKGAVWYNDLPKLGTEDARVHPWADILPRDASEAGSAFIISELSVEPKFTQKDALQLLEAPWLVKLIIAGIESASGSIMHKIAAKALETKNDSSATAPSE